MYEAQGGKCANGACDDAAEVVDHDHETDRVRELLCPRCNLAAGMLGDSAAKARGLADYLEKHKCMNDSAPAGAFFGTFAPPATPMLQL